MYTRSTSGSSHRPYHGQDTAVRVVAGFGRLEAQMRGNSADIIHHGRNIRKYILVFALQDIIGSVTFGYSLIEE